MGAKFYHKVGSRGGQLRGLQVEPLEAPLLSVGAEAERAQRHCLWLMSR